MDKKNLLASAVVALIIVLGLTYLGLLPSKTIVTEIVKNLGAVSGTSFQGPQVEIAETGLYVSDSRFDSATTTPCTVRSPVTTSSLVAYLVNQTQSTSSAMTWTVATSTVPNASTTVLNSKAVGAGALFSYAHTGNLASTTSLFAPNIYITANVDARTGGTNPLTTTGSCHALFIKVSN